MSPVTPFTARRPRLDQRHRCERARRQRQQWRERQRRTRARRARGEEALDIDVAMELVEQALRIRDEPAVATATSQELNS